MGSKKLPELIDMLEGAATLNVLATRIEKALARIPEPYVILRRGDLEAFQRSMSSAAHLIDELVLAIERHETLADIMRPKEPTPDLGP